MITNSSDLLNNFYLNIIEELLCGWVNTVTEHKVMEEHDTHFRSQMIKLIGLILPSTPNSNHIEIRSYHIFKKSLYFFRIWCSRIKHIRWHIICSFTVHFITVNDQCECIWCLVQTNCSYSVWYTLCMNHFFSLKKFHLKIIKVRLSDSIWPP